MPRFEILCVTMNQKDFSKLKEEIEQRDYNDKTREFSPLVKAIDAIEIDTSFMSVEQVIGKVLSYIK